MNKLADDAGINVNTAPLRSAIEELLRTSLNLDSIRTELSTELERMSENRDNVASSMISHVKKWFGHKFGFGEESRPWKFRLERDSYLELRDMQAYVLAPEHAPAVDLYQPPMDMTGKLRNLSLGDHIPTTRMQI